LSIWGVCETKSALLEFRTNIGVTYSVPFPLSRHEKINKELLGGPEPLTNTFDVISYLDNIYPVNPLTVLSGKGEEKSVNPTIQQEFSDHSILTWYLENCEQRIQKISQKHLWEYISDWIQYGFLLQNVGESFIKLRQRVKHFKATPDNQQTEWMEGRIQQLYEETCNYFNNYCRRFPLLHEKLKEHTQSLSEIGLCFVDEVGESIFHQEQENQSELGKITDQIGTHSRSPEGFDLFKNEVLKYRAVLKDYEQWRQGDASYAFMAIKDTRDQDLRDKFRNLPQHFQKLCGQLLRVGVRYMVNSKCTRDMLAKALVIALDNFPPSFSNQPSEKQKALLSPMIPVWKLFIEKLVSTFPDTCYPYLSDLLLIVFVLGDTSFVRSLLVLDGQYPDFLPAVLKRVSSAKTQNDLKKILLDTGITPDFDTYIP